MTSTAGEIPAPSGLSWLVSAWGRSRRFGAFLASSIAGLVLGGIIIWVTGHNPLEAYGALLQGAFGGPNYANLVSTTNRAIPIVGMGLAAAIAFRAGFFNLGGEGQLVLGALAAAFVTIYIPLPGPLLLPAGVIGAALAGGLWALFAAVLQFRFAVPLLISTLILNYPARYFASYLIGHPFRDVMTGMSESLMVPANAQIPSVFGTSGLHAGLFILIVLILGAAFVLKRTTVGYAINMTGLNPRFARYGGISIARLGYLTMFASGAVAGVVGAIQVMAVDYRFIDGSLTDPGYAWTGLMAALLAASAPLGVAGVGFFFSALETGAFGMEQQTSVPRELAQVLQAVIILLIVARANFRVGDDSSRGST